MSFKRKAGASVLSVALLAAIVGMAVTFSAFSSTTENPGNNFKAGTVVLGPNGASVPINTSNMKPGDVETSCIPFEYTGTLAAQIRLYGTTTTSAPGNELAPYLHVKIERTPRTGDCSTVIYEGLDPVLYQGMLSDYPTNVADGILDSESWSPGDTFAYRVTVSMPGSDNAAQGKDAQTTLKFEARSQ
jgi:hypothetical protein